MSHRRRRWGQTTPSYRHSFGYWWSHVTCAPEESWGESAVATDVTEIFDEFDENERDTEHYAAYCDNFESALAEVGNVQAAMSLFKSGGRGPHG